MPTTNLILRQLRLTVPKDLTDVSNGRLRKVTDNGDGTRTFDWFVSNPINNYGVNVNIANYNPISRHFSRGKRGSESRLLRFAPGFGKSQGSVPAGKTDAQGIRTLVRPLPFL